MFTRALCVIVYTCRKHSVVEPGAGVEHLYVCHLVVHVPALHRHVVPVRRLNAARSARIAGQVLEETLTYC